LYREELEATARHCGNPFVYTGRFAAATSLGPRELIEQLAALRLPTPPLDAEGEPDWWNAAWWDGLVALLSDPNARAYFERLKDPPPSVVESERLLRVGLSDLWQLFDRYRTHEVVPIELERA
jgi:hypothetical protein